MSRRVGWLDGVAAPGGVDEMISAEQAEFAGMGGLNQQAQYLT